MRIKHFLVLLLIAGVLFAFCACGASGGSEAGSEQTSGTAAGEAVQNTAPAGENQTPAADEQTPVADEQPPAPVEDEKTAYTVKVVDGSGNPMSGVMVQICKESCMPAMTNAEGIATFRVADIEGYKVSFTSVPEGYTAEAEEFYFEDGSTELTLTLTAA